MAKNKPKTKEKLTKKEVDKAIQEKLAGVLADYRQDLGEKKFTTRIKKASKLFSRAVAKLSKKNNNKKVNKVDPVTNLIIEQK